MFAGLRSRRTLSNAVLRSDFIVGRRWRTLAAHSPQQIAAGEFIKNEATLPIKELVTLRDVIYLLNKTNKHLIKKSILQQFGMPLKDILLYIYNPHIRMYLTSAGLMRYAERKQQQEDSKRLVEIENSSIMSILNELQTREVTGHAAMDRIGAFLIYIRQLEDRVKDDIIVQKATLEDVFYRCLDRNIRAGINQVTVHEVFGGNRAKTTLPILTKKWPAEVKHGAHTLLTSIRGAVNFDPRPAHELEINDTNTFQEVMKAREDEEKGSHPKSAKKKMTVAPTSGPYGVALGKAASLESFRGLFSRGPGLVSAASKAEEGPSSWYLSRKLDGVRCIVRLDIDVSEGVKAPLQIINVDTLSRTERPFSSLDVLKKELATLLRDCPIVYTLAGKVYKNRRAPSQIVSIYLDGELCSLVPGEDTKSDDNFTEDFSEIVGIVRRKSYTVPHPAYFPFDVLTEVEFRDWRARDEEPDDHEPFFTRRRRVKDLVEHCKERKSVTVRNLDQVHVTTFEQVTAWAEKAAASKWEGLILRKGNRYEGKRSPSIRKFKHWLDAEYTVCDVQKAVMRLPVDQVYEDREVMASVSIKHNDIEVLVGSGFTVEERIRYGNDPSLIIGKDITVQYFSESNSAARAKEGDLSLRFPRVKKVWEDGSRDV